VRGGNLHRWPQVVATDWDGQRATRYSQLFEFARRKGERKYKDYAPPMDQVCDQGIRGLNRIGLEMIRRAIPTGAGHHTLKSGVRLCPSTASDNQQSLSCEPHRRCGQLGSLERFAWKRLGCLSSLIEGVRPLVATASAIGSPGDSEI